MQNALSALAALHAFLQHSDIVPTVGYFNECRFASNVLFFSDDFPGALFVKAPSPSVLSQHPQGHAMQLATNQITCECAHKIPPDTSLLKFTQNIHRAYFAIISLIFQADVPLLTTSSEADNCIAGLLDVDDAVFVLDWVTQDIFPRYSST